MNLEHLHDTLDHWKRSLIAGFRDILSDVSVVPMFPDQPQWTPTHLQCYADVLGVAPGRVLLAARPFSDEDRSSYFADSSLQGHFDLFLDPDTGIETPKTCADEHVSLDNLESLLNVDGDRLLLVYQHSQPYNMRDSMLDRLTALRTRWPGVFAIWAGATSMVFVSRSQVRSTGAWSKASSWLGLRAVNGPGNLPSRSLR